MDKIFDPYFTTKFKNRGTGLGLAVSLKIAKNHGGEIILSSRKDADSTFDVYLPRIEKKTIEVKKNPGFQQIGNERILFIDDEESLVDLGKQMLEHLGYDVVVQTDSLKALELFRSQAKDFDLVITDMTMPNLTGDQLATKLMAIRPDILIVLCTGFSEVISKEEAEKMGISAFIMKPYGLPELSEIIRALLDKRK